MLQASHPEGLGSGIGRPGLGHYLTAPFARRPALSWECVLPTSVAFGLGRDGYEQERTPERPGLPRAGAVEVLIAAQTTMIGAGEELYFRGVLFPEMNAWLGSPYLAWFGQALTFGLRKAIAAHAWWDLRLLSFDYLADGEAPPLVFRLRF